MKRTCLDCGKIIDECMGSVVAGDFLQLIKTGLPIRVREICGKCTLARAEGLKTPTYPQK